MQTLSLIKLNNLTISSVGVRIVISDLIKTSAPGREQPILILPYFQENKSICPATALEDYLFVTKDLRPTGSQNILITVKKPHRAASAQSISRWIKQMLTECGVDTSTFSAYSTRHASTSAARSAGVSLDIIRRAAGWTKTSETFARFYNRPINDDSEFARSIFLDNVE